MTEHHQEFINADLTGARFEKTRLNQARFRMCDLSGVVMRDLSLSGASIDGCEIDGLLINGVEIGPLVEAELTRRDPARALRRATDPAGLQGAWAAVEAGWTAVCQQAAELPPGSTDISVAGEWSFAETLRHLVFATDAWLEAIEPGLHPFHPWGVPFTEVEEFIDGSVTDLGLDVTARPTYNQVLDLRADRVAAVRQFLAGVTADRLTQENPGPPWDRESVSAIRCLWVILNEECEHLRFARRDLDAIAAAQ